MPLERITFNAGDAIGCKIIPSESGDFVFYCEIEKGDGAPETLGDFEFMELPHVRSVTLDNEVALDNPRDILHAPGVHAIVTIDKDMTCSLDGGKHGEGYDIYDCEAI